MRLVQIESPYAGDVFKNIQYLRLCMRDCLMKGEAPYASHGLYTQPFVLDDNDPEERKLGVKAGWSFLPAVEAVVVYADLGISSGMKGGITRATNLGMTVEYRTIGNFEALLEEMTAGV